METSDIFESKVSNQLNILKCVNENDGIANIDKISKTVGLDPKTVKLLWLNTSELIEEHHDLSNMSDYLDVRINIFKESWVFDLCENLILGREISIISFLLNHYLSESRLRKKIIDINKLLEPLELKIISRKGFLSIRGTEVQIRHLGHQFFWSIFKGIQWPFDHIDSDNIVKMFKNIIFSDTDLTIKDATYAEWSFVFAINLSRINQGHEIVEEELPEYIYDLLSNYPIYQLEPILNELSEHFRLTKAEQYYFLLQVQMRAQFYLEDRKYNQILEAHRKANTDIYKVHQYFISYLKERMSYPEGKRLAEAIVISSSVSASMVKGFFRPISGYEMEDFFKECAPNLIPHIEAKIQDMQNEYPEIEFLEETNFLKVKFAEAYSLACNMMGFEKEIFVGVITDLSTSFEELLVRKLKSHFYLIDNVKFLTMNQQEIDSYDLVIKTSVTFSDMRKKGEKFLLITPMLDKNDIANISDALKEIRLE